MNLLLILVGILAISVVFKPSALDRSLSKTPLVVFELSDRTAWQEDSEVVSWKATQMLIGALLRSGQCEIINEGDFQYLPKEEKAAGKNPSSERNRLSEAKYDAEFMTPIGFYESLDLLL